MLFCKLCGEMTGGEEIDAEKKSRREVARRIAVKTTEFNGSGTSKYCFLSELGDAFVTIGVISTERLDFVDLAERYADCIGVSVKLEYSEEITLGTLQNLLNNANRQDFIEDENTILSRFGLDRICGRRGRDLEFGENLIHKDVSKEELIDTAKRLFAGETLLPEIERIYSGSRSPLAQGHPVHYIVETDDRDVRRELYQTLLATLHNNGRLKNCRYAFLDFLPGESYSRMAYESLYKISDGGAVVVRYLAENDSDEDIAASFEQAVIEHLCEMAKRYRNQVLTVFCFPRECKKIKAQFYENLGSLAFVDLREDFIGSASAKNFLASLAKDHHVRTDKKLFTELREDRSYLATELRDVFEEWYNRKLTTTVYPQYKELATARKETVKAKPQGSAYDELSAMIGLQGAKQVLQKALNYYKMQKLYEEKGIKRDAPTMHMVFSGNPGTAKTTVARLFARIMRENGLLSKGHLVEVGRGDLVGKYVGWTARIVKEKFKEATGGVLFIDEAYSLVDGKGGSYGDEAINTIVQEMENRRSDLIVIFAGYPDKMEEFIQKNPGLRSRIAFHVPFADYDSQELCQIADLISRKNGMRITKDAYDKLERAFDIAKVNEDFGNGRYVRNVFEQAKMNQASRLLEKDLDAITTDEIKTITADDIVIPEPKNLPKRRIGF